MMQGAFSLDWLTKTLDCCVNSSMPIKNRKKHQIISSSLIEKSSKIEGLRHGKNILIV